MVDRWAMIDNISDDEDDYLSLSLEAKKTVIQNFEKYIAEGNEIPEKRLKKMIKIMALFPGGSEAIEIAIGMSKPN